MKKIIIDKIRLNIRWKLNRWIMCLNKILLDENSFIDENSFLDEILLIDNNLFLDRIFLIDEVY